MASATTDRRPDRSPPVPVSPGSWLRARPWLVEVVAAVGAWLFDLNYLSSLHLAAQDVPEARDLSAATLLVAGFNVTLGCLSFAVRRRSLRWTSAALLASLLGIAAGGVGLAPALLVLTGAMLYALGSRDRWQVAIGATAAAVGVVVLGSVPIVQAGHTRIGTVGMLVLALLLLTTLGVLAGARRTRVAGLQDRARQLERERDARARIAAAEERARIAREIHDIVSHSLGTMVVMADGAARLSEAEPTRAGELMTRVRDTGRDATAEMRRMLDVLRDDQPADRAPQPGLAQLDRLVDSVRATGHRVDVTVTGMPAELDAGVDLAAYRIVQEALTNARRHGGAMLSLIEVAVHYTAETIELRVRDDGQGSAVAEHDPASTDAALAGHGLVGMRERVVAYGGTLTAGDRHDVDGFEVVAVLPYEHASPLPDGAQR